MKLFKVLFVLVLVAVVGAVLYCYNRPEPQCSACDQIQLDKARLPSSETTQGQLDLLHGYWLQVEGGEFFNGHAHFDGNIVRIVYQVAETDEPVELSFIVKYADAGTLYTSEDDSGLMRGHLKETGTGLKRVRCAFGGKGLWLLSGTLSSRNTVNYHGDISNTAFRKKTAIT